MKDNFIQIFKLFIIAVISAFLLSFVNSITKEPIEKAKSAEMMEAIGNIIPGLTSEKILKDTILYFPDDTFPFKTYIILNPDSSVYAYSILTYTKKGYGGTIKMMVGVNNDFKITGIYPLEFSETPGLGTKMTLNEFKDQFISKSLSNFNFKVKNDGGDIVAITSATITSRAVGDCIEKGLKLLESSFKSTSRIISGEVKDE